MALKLTEKEQLLLQRMTYSGQRAFWKNDEGEDYLLKEYGITESRFKSLCREKYIKRDKQPDGSADIVLNTRGQNYCKKHFTEYLSTPASSHHDRELYASVCNLTQTQLDNAMTAREYRNEIDPTAEAKGTPDIIYREVETEEWEAIEVVTINYKGEEIERKQEWCKRQGITLELVRAS